MPDTNIPASTQFGAVAYLRWRLFVNGFRRKEGAGEFVAKAIVYPVGLLFLLGPVAGAGFSSYAALANGRPDLMAIVFWAIFVLQMLVSVNLSPAAQSFAPESLIRFPLTLTRYVTIRLFLGLLSPSTVTGTCALLAGALGASLAAPGLAPVLFGAALSLALANMLFVRMIFVWIDRWLSTRRSRELLTGLIVCIGIAAQYLNVTFNDIGHHSSRAAQAAKMAAASRIYHHFEPIVAHLPPGLAGAAVLNQSRAHASFAMCEIAGILLYAAVFLAVFTSRMVREYRGEDLSEGITQPKATPQTQAPVPYLASATAETRFGLSPLIAGCLHKELLYLRRNVSQFYGFLAPLAMVFIFAGRLGSFARTGMLFPAAVAYSFLGIAALAYNVLGIDASGIQAYLLAPIRMRDVILAKNLLGFALSGVQLVLVYLLVFFTAGPPPLLLTLATGLWIVAATFFNAAVGNIRSITTPKKVDPNKVQRRQASQLSALMSLGLMLLAGAVGASLILLARALQLPWLPVPVLLVCAVVAGLFYRGVLGRIDSLIYTHRETLLDELTKAS
jgi:ABC-2 type transport system permease protein